MRQTLVDVVTLSTVQATPNLFSTCLIILILYATLYN